MESSFDYQVKACKHIFVDNLPNLEYEQMADVKGPPNTNHLHGPKYDITGFNGHQVVALLCEIVNDKYFAKKNKTFYLFIQGDAQDELQLFRIKANPTDNQPGNGVVSMRPKGKKAFPPGGAQSYEELNGALEAYYDTRDKENLLWSDTKAFANHIKQLFNDNTQITKLPQTTSEVYMIFLFEIARRLVQSEVQSDLKKKLDVLPIGSAIAGFLRLLHDGRATFKEVFIPGGRLHCFTGTPEDREKAIKNINVLLSLDNPQIILNYNFYLQELRKWYSKEKISFEGALMSFS